VIVFFGLALFAAIFISAKRKATDLKKRARRAELIRERLRDQRGSQEAKIAITWKLCSCASKTSPTIAGERGLGCKNVIPEVSSDNTSQRGVNVQFRLLQSHSRPLLGGIVFLLKSSPETVAQSGELWGLKLPFARAEQQGPL
jgi:hypothetical protein